MTFNEKIKLFMFKKEEILQGELDNYEKGLYYNEEIGKLIDNWQTNEAKLVFEILSMNTLLLEFGTIGFSPSTCPFCIFFQSSCGECTYAELNNACIETSSNLIKIKRAAKESKKDLNKLLSRETYKKIIREVELYEKSI